MGKKNFEESAIDYHKVLDYIGTFTKWHLLQALLTVPVTLCAGVAVVSFIFTAYIPKYRCKIAGCEISEAYSSESGEPFNFVQKSIGAMQSGKQTIDDVGQTCTFLPFVNDSTCTQTLDQPISCSHKELIYDTTIRTTSMVSDFGFTCDKHFQRALFNALYMVGMLVGAFFIGVFSDRYGRLNAITLSSILLSSSGVAIAFIDGNLIALGLLRIVTGMGGMGCYMVAYVITAESSRDYHRILLNVIVGIGFAFGELLLGAEAYFIRDWKTLQIVAFAPPIFLVGLRFIIPESTRWLIAKGRHDEARRQIITASKVNGVTVPRNILYPDKGSQEDSQRPLESKAGLKDLFKTPVMFWRTANMCWQWFCVTMVYYGVSFESTSISGDPYLNFSLNIAAEIPTVFISIFLVNKCGRRSLLVSLQLTAGVFSMIGGGLFDIFPSIEDTSTKQAMQGFQVFSIILSKFASSGTFGIVYLYTTELYPTTLRNSAIGCCSSVARLGGILCLLIATLSKFWRPFPLILMGSTATSAGFLAFLFPETTGDRLPETVEDALNLGKNFKSNWCGCKKMKRSDDDSEFKTNQDTNSTTSTDISKSI